MTDLLIISRSFYPKEGGAERQLRQVAGRLCEQGHTVSVLTEAAGDLPSVEVLPTGVRIERIGSTLSRNRRGVQLAFVVSGLIRGLRNNPGVLLSPQLGSASVVAGIVARIRRRPHLVRLTGGGTDRFRSEPLAKASSRLGRVLVSAFARPSTTIVAPARHLLADFAEAFPDFPCDLVHITNGVDVSLDRSAKLRQVIWYSRGGSESSATTFLEIAAALPTVRFTVIGRHLGDSLLSNIDDLGWQKHPENVIAEHAVLLNTSPREGMPNTVLQALAVGCRIVGFQNAGMNELKSAHPDAIELVDSGDTLLAAEAIRRALEADAAEPATIATISEVVDQWIALIKRRLAVGA